MSPTQTQTQTQTQSGRLRLTDSLALSDTMRVSIELLTVRDGPAFTFSIYSIPLWHGAHNYLCPGDHPEMGEDRYMLSSHTANTKCVHGTKLHHTHRSDQSKLLPILWTPNHVIIRSIKKP